MITKFKKPVAASGATIENEPIIKSDGASSDVMQWLSNDESSNITISEDASNNLDLVVSSGNVGVGGATIAGGDTNTLTVSGGDGSATTQSAGLYLQGKRTGTARYARIEGLHGADNTAFIDFYRDGADNAGAIRFGTQAAGGAVTDRLTIDSAGTTTITPTGNVKSLYLSASPATTDTALHVEADELTTGRAAIFYSFSEHTDTRSLVKIWNDNPLSTGTTCLEVTNDSTGRAITATGGIVEEDGVLKENLLTNSGFDVWSNSTLEVVDEMLANDSINSDGSATTGWNVYGGATLAGNQDGGTSGGHDGSACITATGDGASADNGMYSNAFDLESGKLYKVTVWVKGDAGGSAWKMVINDNAGAGTWIGPGNVNSTVNLTTSWAQYTWYGGTYEMAEATTTTARMYLLQIGDASGVISFDDIKVEEVTPGIVTGSAGPDGWVKDGALDLYREHKNTGNSPTSNNTTKEGSFYSLKVVNGSALNFGTYPTAELALVEKFAGRTVTFGFWCKTSTASSIRPYLYDGITSSYGDYHTGGGDWEWLEFTVTNSTTATRFQALINCQAAGTAYISQPMLVFGSAIGEGNYSRPSGEVIDLEKFIEIQSNVTPAAADDKILNLEALSNGKIPKGAKAIHSLVEVQNTSVASGQGIRFGPTSTYPYQLVCYPQINSVYLQQSGRINCDANGDIYQQVTETGATLLGLYHNVNTVVLR